MALALFGAALLSKTVTASLPAAMLLLIWWKRGRVARADVLWLVPFFVLGIGFGLTTVWVEWRHVGAVGEDWDFSIVDRFLIAGRALGFYAGKLIWPTELSFIYPRWAIDAAEWWQYLFQVGQQCSQIIHAREHVLPLGDPGDRFDVHRMHGKQRRRQPGGRAWQAQHQQGSPYEQG